MSAWPSSAKLVMAILIVAALLGAIGTVVGFVSGDDSTTELDAQIATLTSERDDLLAQLAEYDTRIAAVTTERDAVAAELAELDTTASGVAAERDQLVAQLASLDTALAAVTTDRDDLAVRLTELDATFADLTADIAELDESVARLSAERDQLQSSLAAETLRASSAITERDALAALFPMALDADLADVDLVGTYDVDFTKGYCEGFVSCGTVPTVDELQIVETTEGWLRLEMDGFVSAGLFRVPGSLSTIAGSIEAVPACGTTPRVAVVTVTMYPHGLTVADDGTYEISDLGASFTVQSQAIGTCPAGVAVYGGELTPRA